MYSFLKFNRSVVRAVCIASSVAAVSAASSLTPSGTEYRITASIKGDQMLPHMSFNATGGYIVSQDNSVDGNGLGIRARRFYADLSGAKWTIQVNSIGEGHQQNAQVAMQSTGGAVFAWQGSTVAGHRIYLRYIQPDGVFAGPDILVDDGAVGTQEEPSIAVLPDDSVVVIWTEANRDGKMRGIFGRKFTSSGTVASAVFQVNQIADYHQRNGVVSALDNGNFAVAWVTERATDPIDIYARLYRGNAQPIASEFRVNPNDRISANPSIAAFEGGFRVAWSSRTLTFNDEHWDVETRSFSTSGAPLGTSSIVNNTRKGDQFIPKLASAAGRQMIVWTSFGQDGSDEGVYGRVILDNGDFDGDEFLVNTRTRTKQIHPAIAQSRSGEFIVAWTSFVGGVASYDLFAQKYSVHSAEVLPQLPKPFVSSFNQSSISAVWSEVLGQSVSAYLVFVDGETTPIESTEPMLIVQRGNWTPGSTHTVKVAYRLADGRVSPESETATVTTWGADLNQDGLPDDWQTYNWGRKENWPSPNGDSDMDGSTNMEEFFAGTDPLDPNSVLRMNLSRREHGVYIEWACEPGSVYQVQVTTDFRSWENYGGPRFAASKVDALPLTGPSQVRYYRVIRLR